MSTENRPQHPAQHSSLIAHHLLDPRLTAYVDLLPRYSALLRRLQEAPLSTQQGRASPVPTALSTRDACVYVGIKLCESKWHLDEITRGSRTLGRLLPSDPAYGRRWAWLSSQVDSFVFAVYGVLDALAQVVVAAYALETAEEVKFPALERILTTAAPDAPHGSIRAYVAATCQATWFRDLRRLRNLVNYRSVIPTPGGPDAASLGRQVLAVAWSDPPIPALTSVQALPPYCASAQYHVAETVEAAIGALAEGGAID